MSDQPRYLPADSAQLTEIARITLRADLQLSTIDMEIPPGMATPHEIRSYLRLLAMVVRDAPHGVLADQENAEDAPTGFIRLRSGE